jgi:hypothetical protein
VNRPPRLAGLIELLDSSGWSFAVQHGSDSGGALFIAVQGRPGWDDVTAIRVTWHSRDTGTLRLFSCMGRQPYRGWRDLPLHRLRDMIQPEPDREPNAGPGIGPEPVQATRATR